MDGDYRCDFYLPSLHLYIEYWGDEAAPGQLTAKLDKKAVYERHGLKLLEIGPDDLSRLDEILPRALAQARACGLLKACLRRLPLPARAQTPPSPLPA